MLKKLIAVTLLITSMATFSVGAAEKFTTVSIPCPEGQKLWDEDYQKFDSLLLRYKDDKTPIALSEYYDGYMSATVPLEDKEREVETFISEPLSFNDYTDENSYEFYVMERLSKTGLVKGDTDGNARPFGNVTRAEATAMVMRFMGVETLGSSQSDFVDVASDAWYAKAITQAKDYGIVQGDTANTFSPERNITREELTVMVARALWAIGFQKENKVTALPDTRFVKDSDTVSPWAMSAYATLYDNAITDYVETEELDAEGIPMSVGFYSPQKYATRFETARLIDDAQQYYQVYPSRAAIEYGFDKHMPVIDGSTSTYPFTEAIYRNLFANGYNHIDKPQSHSKSHVSYERLINGDIDAMIASVYPAEDILALAAEKGVELELIPIAYDAMVFFTNAENSAKGLTMEQISDIYVNNKYDDWSALGGDNARLCPYARNYDSGSHAQMERHFLHGGDINEKIRRETTSVTMANILTDVMDAKSDNPKSYGLGYSIYYYFLNMDLFYGTKTTLKLLEIDGVYPNDDTIANGSYPLSNNTYVVIRKSEAEDSPARKFAAFMLSDLGQQCVTEAGFGALKK